MTNNKHLAYIVFAILSLPVFVLLLLIDSSPIQGCIIYGFILLIVSLIPNKKNKQ